MAHVCLLSERTSFYSLLEKEQILIYPFSMSFCNAFSPKNQKQRLKINELIALPSSTFVSAQHRSTLIIPPLTTGLEALTHLQRQELMLVLEGLDFESSESRLSWELLEHRITPALELLEQHSRILKNSKFGYERRDMLHREYLQGNRFTLIIGIEKNRLHRDVNEMHSSNQTHGMMKNDHILCISPVSCEETDKSLSFTLLMEVLKSLRIFIFCKPNRKRRLEAEAVEETQREGSSDLGTNVSATPENDIEIVEFLPIFREPTGGRTDFCGCQRSSGQTFWISAVHAGPSAIMHNCSFVLPDPQRQFFIQCMLLSCTILDRIEVAAVIDGSKGVCAHIGCCSLKQFKIAKGIEWQVL